MLGADVGADAHFVGQAAEDARKLRREGGRGHGVELAGAEAVARVAGRVEAADGEEVDDLSRHHVLGADEGAHLSGQLAGGVGELHVEGDGGRGEAAVEAQDAVDGDGALGTTFAGQPLVQVFDVGLEGVDGAEVEQGVGGVAAEVDAAALTDAELLAEHLLEAEIVVALADGVGAVQAQVGVGGILDLQVSGAVTADAIACDGVHDEFEGGVGGDVGGDIDTDLGGVVVRCGHDERGAEGKGGVRQDGGEEADEAVIFSRGGGVKVEAHGRLTVGGDGGVDVDQLLCAAEASRSGAADGAINAGVHLAGHVVEEQVAGGDVGLEGEILQVVVSDGEVQRAGVPVAVCEGDSAAFNGGRGEAYGVVEAVDRVEEVHADTSITDHGATLEVDFGEGAVEAHAPRGASVEGVGEGVEIGTE